MKGINLRIQEFDNDIVEAINKAQLPAKVFSMIFSGYAMEMEQAHIQAVTQDVQTYKQEGENQNEKNADRRAIPLCRGIRRHGNGPKNHRKSPSANKPIKKRRGI